MTLGKTYLIIPILFGIGLTLCEINNLQVYWPDDPEENFFGILGTFFFEIFLNPMRLVKSIIYLAFNLYVHIYVYIIKILKIK